jgi:hypothetical protein
MGPKVVAMVAEVIDRLRGQTAHYGTASLPTIKVVEALRFFVREGVPSGAAIAAPVLRTGARQSRARRELRAAAGRASGATLRRRLIEWWIAPL